ncbi:GIY-YIG nuclease family protein [Anaerofustis sp.]|uniref:GIY-YIG nuclease family protein n=1 Tax=Anaerofustis sp. TaxID=1872517 RepID=UPI0025C014B2|nr:GIY-YIG nuclease family protein [Anaerofustis sp.]
MYYTYMLRCIDNTIYTGITTDVKRRVKEHIQRGSKCAKYTLKHRVKNLECVWKSENRIMASKLEYRIKKLTKSEKEMLIKNPHDLHIYFDKILNVEEYENVDTSLFY